MVVSKYTQVLYIIVLSWSFRCSRYGCSPSRMLTILHLSIYQIQKFQQSLFPLQSSLFPFFSRFPFSSSFGYITLMYISNFSNCFLTFIREPLAASRTARVSFPDAQSVWNPRVGDIASSNIKQHRLIIEFMKHATYETIWLNWIQSWYYIWFIWCSEWLAPILWTSCVTTIFSGCVGNQTVQANGNCEIDGSRLKS